jgi:mRNA interferase RelE/StbE
MYKVLITKTAEKQLKKLSADHQRKIAAMIVSLGIEPRPFGSKRLTGTKNTYRVRTGDYRIIYDIFEKEVLVSVLKLGHRKDVYR